ncbi:MAG: hypothetical protein K2X72_05335 [Reyranella sp.]|nr:hypothetical protein [Reyranella sp.]
MTALPPLLLLLVLVAGALAASEIGYWLGWLTGKRDDVFDRQLGIVRGATFAVVAFLIGFAFSGAASRYVDRLDIIVKEANAIGTAWLRADTLAEPARGRLKAALRDYTADRVALLQEDDMSAILARIAKAGSFHDRLWKAGLEGTQGNPSLALLVLPSLNDVIDLHTTHLSAARRHLPTAIFVALLVTAGLSLGLAAFGHGQVGRRFTMLDGMYSAVLAAALWMTIDLDYPRYGFIRTNIAPMVETLAGMKL